MSRLRLYTRDGCGLCEELLAELAPWAAQHGTGVDLIDVDADPDTRRRYGLRIPVLQVDGVTASSGHLDLAEVERLWNAPS